MWKLALILFIIIGPTFAGLGALVPLSIYGVGDFNALLLIGGAAAGAAIAAPVSYWVATRIGVLMDASSART
ncbi:hypothetical protein FMN63_22510 [Stappia sp. BW2]|jgi:hypothetical protein|uniref:hypothetical protein n=1 Tax=Stappia sp. BW2 TaxID=2592622 RepID=UPI0011DEB6AB|nr:hypothetical protein [Stappia sp. BW2]TYC65199.1 hypothetical protein FMN63_22510 [Stappia sp. BW2]